MAPEGRLTRGQPALAAPRGVRPQLRGCARTKLIEEPGWKRESKVEADYQVVLVQTCEMLGDFLAIAASLQADKLARAGGLGEPDVTSRHARIAGPVDRDHAHQHIHTRQKTPPSS